VRRSSEGVYMYVDVNLLGILWICDGMSAACGLCVCGFCMKCVYVGISCVCWKCAYVEYVCVHIWDGCMRWHMYA
jgi:hypothetical protein